MATPKDLPRDVGGFIRDLRRNARISLRQLAEQAGVSNPYLSQIERGLRKPSAEVLQQLASALRVSTPVMYLRAGLLDDPEGHGVLAAIAADPDLSMAQKQSLSQIYETFRRENARHAAPAAGTEPTADPAGTEPAAASAGTEPTADPAEAESTNPDPAEVSAPVAPPAATAQAEAVLESVAVTEAGAAAAPTGPRRTKAGPRTTTSSSNTRPTTKIAKKAVRKAADPATPDAGPDATTAEEEQ